ncbi:MAG: hypothetical protein KAS71_17650 [Bacteroidales bacterium]|nr:hypothetical protein [Bacteroidales bacterium]
MNWIKIKINSLLINLIFSVFFQPIFSNGTDNPEIGRLLNNYPYTAITNSNEYSSDELSMNPVLSNDSCVETLEFVRRTVMNFIQNGNELIYEDSFIISILKVNKYHGDCYFPGNSEDVLHFYLLGDSILLEKVKYDERAMRLIINLYFAYNNNAELSEYFSTHVIPQAALNNIVIFAKILSERPEKEANRCIRKLRVIVDEDEIQIIKKEIYKIDNTLPEIANQILQVLSISNN